MNFKFYSTPGHGYLAVPAELLEQYGVKERITGFSGLCNGIAYLEEDLDASTFLKALDTQGAVYKIDNVHVEYWPSSRAHNYPESKEYREFLNSRYS